MKIYKDYSREIFGYPNPPQKIWENQFDGFDEKLSEILVKPCSEVSGIDLEYYMYDLAYIEKLQEDLFEYLFPLCLNFWYETLMRDEPASSGLMDFHFALVKGKILQRMMDSSKRDLVYNFIHDGFLDRIELWSHTSLAITDPNSCNWVFRLNSLAITMPVIEKIWRSWWQIDSPGKAICALVWISGIMYQPEDNPIFGIHNYKNVDTKPYIYENDAFPDGYGWTQDNLRFLKNILDEQLFREKIEMCCVVLSGRPEEIFASQIYKDLSDTFSRDISHSLIRSLSA